MKRCILSAALFGAGAVGPVFAAAGEALDGADPVAAALHAPPPPAALRRVESVQAAVGPDNTCDPNGLCLRVTVGTDLDLTACGDQTVLYVTAGDQVNFCYTVTNGSDTAFEYQTASDNVGRAERQFFLAFKHTIEPHSTYRFNRIETMRETQRATTTWTGTAAVPEYSYDDTAPFDWIDIAGTGTDLDIGEYAQTSVEMPFAVDFYGIPSRYLAVSNSGVAFGVMRSDYIRPWAWDLPIPCILFYAAVCPMIVPFGMNGFAEPYGGGVYTQTLGAAPNRRFVVQWTDMPTSYLNEENQTVVTAGGVTYQLAFDEGGDDILFQYRHAAFDTPVYPDADNGAAAVVGLNFGGMPLDAAVATAYSQYTASLSDGLAIRWTPSAVATSVATARTTVNVRTPSVAVSADAIEAAVASHGSATSTLTLSNRAPGTVVQWSFGQPGSGAHLPVGERVRNAGAGAAIELPVSELPRLLRARRDENARQAATGSPLRLPMPRSPSTASPRVPLGAADVPAYAVLDVFDLDSDYIDKQQLARGDLAAPQTIAPVNEVFTSQGFLSGAYLMDFMDDDFTTIYTMDGPDLMAFNTASGTGVPVVRFDLPNLVLVKSFNYLPSERVFYAYLCRGSVLDCRLHKLDPRTGSVEAGAYLADGNFIVSLAMAASGEMYAVGLQPGGQLLAVDRISGDVRAVGDMHVLNDGPVLVGWYMDFDDRSGVLYLTAYDPNSGESVIHTVDTTTGLAQEVGRYPLALAGLAIATGAPLQSCTDLASAPWLSLEPSSGTLDYGYVDIAVDFDASGLADGVYTANLCLNTNDPQRRHIVIPATLTVGGADAIFRNGFD